MDTVIETQNLVKKYGRVQALQNLNMKIPKGTFGLIGPNAAGKSTTIKILLGLVRATSGKAMVFGLDAWKDSFAIRKRIGVLHEKPTFPGWVIGLDYVEYLATLKGLREPRSLALKELKSFGLEKAYERKIGTYSAGMVQRLGLAQAFVGDPELVFLDEPTANLDPLGRAEFLGIIKERSRSLGINVIISTHILSELERVCDAVAIIFGGIALETGKLNDLFKKYSEGAYVIKSGDNKRLMNKLEQLDYVENAWIEEDTLKVKVSNQHRFEKDCVSIAHNLGVGIKRFEPIWCTLEHVYKKVLGAKGVET